MRWTRNHFTTAIKKPSWPFFPTVCISTASTLSSSTTFSIKGTIPFASGQHPWCLYRITPAPHYPRKSHSPSPWTDSRVIKIFPLIHPVGINKHKVESFSIAPFNLSFHLWEGVQGSSQHHLHFIRDLHASELQVLDRIFVSIAINLNGSGLPLSSYDCLGNQILE